MKRVERTHWLRKGLQRTNKDVRLQLEQVDAVDQYARSFDMCRAKFSPVDAVHDLVFEKPAGGQKLRPEALIWPSLLGKERGKRNGGVKIDHRSARSASISDISSSNVMVGMCGGGPLRR